MSEFQRLVSVGAVFAAMLWGCGGNSPPGESNALGTAEQAVTYSESVLGFETLVGGAWTATGSSIAADDRRSEGEHSARVSVGANQSFTLKSGKIAGIPSPTDRIWIDLWVPSVPSDWRGFINAFIEVPSRGLYNEFIGILEFAVIANRSGYDRFVRVSLPLNQRQRSAIAGAQNDLVVSFQGSAPANSQFLLDRVYLGQATTPANSPSEATINVNLPSGLEFRAAAVDAADGVDIGVGARVLATNGYGAIGNVSDKPTTLARDSVTGNVFSVPSVRIESGARVNGLLRTSGSVEPASLVSAVSGGVTPGAVLRPFNQVSWTVTIPSSTLPGISLEPGVVRPSPIATGHYGTTTLREGSRLVLSAGTYFFDQLYLERGSVLDIDNSRGVVVIYVLDSLLLRGNVVRQAATQAGDVLFVYLGEMPASIDTGLPATFIASQSDVVLEPQRSVNGAIFGSHVTLSGGSTVTLQPFQRSDCATAASTCNALPGCPLSDADHDGLSDCRETSDSLFWTSPSRFNGMLMRLYAPCHSQGVNNELIDTQGELDACIARTPLEEAEQSRGFSWDAPSTTSSCNPQYGFSQPWTACRNDWMIYSEGFLRVESNGQHCFALQGGTSNAAASLFVDDQSSASLLGAGAHCYGLTPGVHRLRMLYEQTGGTAQPFSLLYCKGGSSECTPIYPIDPQELRSSNTSSDALCDSTASCSELCPCGSGARTCTADAQCQEGSVCGDDNGANFGWTSGTRVCWPSSCKDSSLGSECSRRIVGCESDSDCSAGEVCGTANSAAFLHLQERVCWPAACETQSTTGSCGGLGAACGVCACTPNCANKRCGDDPRDGCGGLCRGYCKDGQTGCKQNLDCVVGSVCVPGGAKYWGGSADESACMPKSCLEQPPQARDCGTATSVCGTVCDACVPECAGRECGVDPKCGVSCGSCDAGEFCNGAGLCEVKSESPILRPIQAVVAPSQAGSLEGAFAVSSTGQARYSVPIFAPPGVNGLKPSVTLEYDSATGMGPLGVGWRIGGLSSIRRCPRTYANCAPTEVPEEERAHCSSRSWSSFDDDHPCRNNQCQATPIAYDDRDQFCLDGVPLVPVVWGEGGPTYYSPENDPFTRVAAYPDDSATEGLVGPTRFELRAPDGKVMVYGGDNDSTGTIKGVRGIQSEMGARTSWALSEVTDQNGNFISYLYGDLGDYTSAGERQTLPGHPTVTVGLVHSYEPHLKAIWYGGGEGDSHNAEIVFQSEDLSYVGKSSLTRKVWHSGVPRFVDSRYRQIIVTGEDGEVRNYRLGYDDSTRVDHLTSIQECHGDACKPPTQFEYGEVPAFNASESVEVPIPKQGNNVMSLRSIAARLDMNGDGREDFLLSPVLDARNPLDCTGHDFTLALASGNRNAPFYFIPYHSSRTNCLPISAADLDGRGRASLLIDNLIVSYDEQNGIKERLRPGDDLQKWYDDDGDGTPAWASASPQRWNPPRGLCDLDSDGVLEELHGGWAKMGVGVEFEPQRGDEIEQDSFVRKMKAEAPKCRALKPLSFLCFGDCKGDKEIVDYNHELVGSGELSVCEVYLAFNMADWGGGIKALDANGDGLQDFVEWHPGAGESLKFRILENTGRRQFISGYAPRKEGGELPNSLTMATAKSFQQSFAYDTDRDGRDELVIVTKFGSFFRVPLRIEADDTDDATRIERLPGNRGPVPGDYDKFMIADVDGNGAADVIYGDDTMHILYQEAKAPDRLIRVTDGLGRVDRVEYQSGYDAPYDAKLASAWVATSLPMKLAPRVVNRHEVLSTTERGLRSELTEDYSYAYGRIGKFGRGPLGFGTVTRAVTANGVPQYTETTEYDVDTYVDEMGLRSAEGGVIHHWYPFAGRATHRVRTYPNVPIGIGSDEAPGEVIEEEGWRYSVRPSWMGRPFTYVDRHFQTLSERRQDGQTRQLSEDVTTFAYNEGGSEDGRIHTLANGTGQVVERTETRRWYEFTNAGWGEIWPHRLPTRISTSTTVGNSHTSLTEDIEYDSLGQVQLRETGRGDAALSKVARYAYNSRGNVESVIDSSPLSSRMRLFGYDARGQYVETETDALGHVTTNAYYKGYGAPALHEDVNHLISSTEIDGFGRVVATVDPQGVRTNIRFESVSGGPAFLSGRARIAEIRTREGSAEERTYFDALGRRIGSEEVHHDGRILRTASGFDGMGRMTWQSVRPFTEDVEPAQVTRRYFDATGRMRFAEWPDDYAPRGMGYVRHSFTSPANWPNDEVSSSELERASHLVRHEYTDGTSELELLDLSGRKIAKLDAAGATTAFQYGAHGLLEEVRDAAGLTTTMRYDALGRLVETHDRVSGDSTVVYSSSLSETVTTENAAGTVERSNDALGRPISESRPEGTTRWTYDTAESGTGMLAEVEGPRSTLSPGGTRVSYTYGPASGRAGARGKVRQVSRTIAGETFTTGYEYDSLGRVSVQEYPSSAGRDFRVSMEYNADGTLTSVRDASTNGDHVAYWELVQQNELGKTGTERLLGAIEGTYTYSNYQERTDSVTYRREGRELSRRSYRYDGTGNITTLGVWENGTLSDSSRIYEYDEASRLQRAYRAMRDSSGWVKGDETLGVEFDRLGNLIGKSDVGTITYEMAENPYAATSAGLNLYRYDSLGRQYMRTGPDIAGGLQTIDYASFGLPLQITSGADDVTRFAYDGLREQVISDDGETRTVQAGDLYQRITSLNSPERDKHVYRVQAGGRTVAEVIVHERLAEQVGEREVRALLTDHLGGPVMSVDRYGVVQRTHFDEYGRALEPLVSESGAAYAGYQRAANTGLIKMGVRFYDPMLGRVLTPDGILSDKAGQDGLNPYAYALNRPTRYVDPSGYQSSVPPIPTITDYWNASGGAYPGVSAVVPFDWSLQLGAQYGQLLQSAQANGLGYALTHSEYVGSWLFQTPMGDRVMLNAQLTAQGVSVASLTLATGAGLGAIVTGSTTLFGMEIGITTGGGASLSASVGATLAEAGPTVAAGAAKAAPTLSSEISALENEVQAVTAEGGIGATGRIGEEALQALGGESQVFFRTSQGGRFVDQFVEGVAHESKVGYQYLSETISTQIAKDAELLQTGQVSGYTWHFFESPITGRLGPSGPLQQALENAGIGVEIHW